MSLTYLLVEDERPARLRLKRLLGEARPGSLCVGEASDGVGGLELLGSRAADALFLDIEFPPEGAFGMLARAREAGLSLPPIVFTTAYDQYAVEAFRWAAWDYLLKPVERPRLEEALQRIEARRMGGDDLPDLMHALDATRRAGIPERFTVRVKGGLKQLAWKDVSSLSTENRLLFVHAREGSFVLDRTLDELESLLAPRFVRCHRKAMIALDALRELHVGPGGTGEAWMVDGHRLPVSRERLPALRQRLP